MSGYAKHIGKMAALQNKLELYNSLVKEKHRCELEAKKTLDTEREEHLKRLYAIAAKHSSILQDMVAPYISEIQSLESKIKDLKCQIKTINEKVVVCKQEQQKISDAECNNEADAFENFHEQIIKKLQSDFDKKLKEEFGDI